MTGASCNNWLNARLSVRSCLHFRIMAPTPMNVTWQWLSSRCWMTRQYFARPIAKSSSTEPVLETIKLRRCRMEEALLPFRENEPESVRERSEKR